MMEPLERPHPFDASSLAIRRLTVDDADSVFPVLRQLRTLQSVEELRERLARLEATVAYECHGAFHGAALLGILGLRAVETFARGRHLHIDDLVVDAPMRRRGIGRALLDFAEDRGRADGRMSLFLDSRPDAVAFYLGRGFSLHTSPLMRKPL